MRIENLFKKDIFRQINGVVKADQLDESSTWQELDEFVITRELDQHFRKFFSNYCAALDSGGDMDVTGKIGIWVSGFFGSGKSHFIKVLSYLLRNEEHRHDGETKRAVDFFESKIADALLFGDIKRAVASDTDVILFNIDSKADSRAGRDAILAVFLKVLNEMQGFSGDHAHIAHMERYLAAKGKLAEFHTAYRKLSGSDWIEERDAYEFNRDEVVAALVQTLGQSKESCAKWIDSAEGNFALTIESFCKWVKEYLDSKGPSHRLIFLVDEVGQFIGTDTHLMLSLQTITEDLGTICKGRAWIVVTSQEDIDAVLGEMQAGRANDFSKIQGRFKTRLSLSSANVDEVIQERLLAKREDARPELERVFAQKGDILKNQLSFKNVGMTFKQFTDADDFIKSYPFAPYQFKLLQKIFESIRKVGATGLHLAQGERSLLDAFQSAGKTVAGQEVGVLVPLYHFYPSIESFLDTAVKRTIDHARANASLEPFDSQLLEVLFLIRYVEEVKGNVDNLVTLCLDEIDADRLALRKKIEESLQRLERETLISRSGDNYFFLTNEERDINREIKGVDLSGGEAAKLLGELIYEDALKGQRKYRYNTNKVDFTFNRFCDMHPVGNRVDGGLLVSVVTPLAEEYEAYTDSKCAIDSTQENGQVLIRLGDNESLGRELRTWIKTDTYLRTKDDGTLSPATKRIHRDLADENRGRRERLSNLLGEMVAEARCFVAGQRLEPKADTPQAVLDEALEYLIQNTFAKMGYLKTLLENPLKEIQAVLRSNDVSQRTLDLNLPENNPQAIEDVRNYIELCTKTSKQIVIHDMLNGRYAGRPYGWPPLEVVLILAKLCVAGEIHFVTAGAPIPHEKVYEAITTPAKWRKITVVQRMTAKPEVVRKARELGKEIFSEMGPEAEDDLFTFLQKKFTNCTTCLASYKTLADTGTYPGGEEIAASLGLTKALLAVDESNKFLERFIERKSDLLEFSESFHDLENFYEHQRPTWEKLRKAVDDLSQNRMQLEAHESARPALARMEEILTAQRPYKLLHEVEALTHTARSVNDQSVAAARGPAVVAIRSILDGVTGELEKAAAGEALRMSATGELTKLLGTATKATSLAHIAEAQQTADAAYDRALTAIDKARVSPPPPPAGGGPAPPSPPVPRKRRIVEARAFWSSGFIETQADVETFLKKLRAELEAALKADERIQIK